jgi:putative transposase
VVYVTAYHGYSERRACRLIRQARATQHKPSVRDPRTAIRLRMHEIAQTRVRYGYRRVHILLRREGWTVGRNLIYRLYREEGLVLRKWRRRRRKTAVKRAARHHPQRP